MPLTPGKMLNNVSLQKVLLIPFVTLTILAVALVGYISYRSGQESVNNVTLELRSEINARIEEHLQTIMGVPHRINKANAGAIRRGSVELENQALLVKHFWEQIQMFGSVTSIYFGNNLGGLANAGREGAEGQLYVIYTDDFTSGPFNKYATDLNGDQAELLLSVPDFDARERSWYKKAVAKKAATWSDIYILFSGQDMAVSASLPVYDAEQKLLGVAAVDLFLSHLSDYLEKHTVGKTGQSFIIEPSGYLIATSTGEKPFTASQDSNDNQRVSALESTNPLTRSAAIALAEHYGDFTAISETRSFELNLNGARQWGQVMPFNDAYGLNWLIVTVIPESDFMAQINRNNQVTIILMLFTLVVTVLVSVFITRKIISPITGLNTGARALAEGKWEETIPQQTRIEEIQALVHSFNHMAGQLRQMVTGLTYEVTERKKAEEELALLNFQLKAKNQELEQLIYIASHDLRSPLVNIDGYGRELEYSVSAIKQAVQEQATSLEALKIALDAPAEEISESLHYIRSSTLQMDALLKGMLKLSRTGRMSLTIDVVDMNDLLAQVIASLDYQLQAAETEVTIANLPPCRGDSVQISQVFLNVIANAIKFLDPDRPGFIRISGDVVDEKAVYCVEDNGIGIAAEEREKIFEVFVRLNPQNCEGEGLGLTIVRQVLGRLGGDVWVESTPGEGSRFYLALPAVRPGDQKKKRGSKVEQ